MNQTTLPDANAIAQLLALGQAALACEQTPIRWQTGGGLPWPTYPQALKDFFAAAAQPPWSDSHYQPQACSALIRAEDGIARADLATLCSLLTWMVRGERFCDGHWAAMLEQGHLRRWLERLAAFA